MSMANSSINDTDSSADSVIPIPSSVEFWLMLLFNVPSLICDFILIIHILKNRTQRYALQNHSILLVLMFNVPIQLTDINFYLIYFHYGSVQPSQPIVCLIWLLDDFGFFSGGLIMMAWLAVQRHILVFHDRWIGNRRGRFLFHYLPLIILNTYVLLFYIVAIFGLLCQNTYDYTSLVCGASPCYQSYGVYGIWDYIVNTTGPILIEGVASTSFLLRIVFQQRALRRSTQWHKYRRMTIQLLLMSGLNMICNLPSAVFTIARLFGLPYQYGAQAEVYFFFLGYFLIFLFPFICLCQFPDLRKSIKEKIFFIVPRDRHRLTAVTPATIGTRIARI
jgi:hypothetical protein